MFIHYMTKITKNVKILFFDSGGKSIHMHVKNFCLLGKEFQKKHLEKMCL